MQRRLHDLVPHTLRTWAPFRACFKMGNARSFRRMPRHKVVRSRGDANWLASDYSCPSANDRSTSSVLTCSLTSQAAAAVGVVAS